MNTNRIVLGFLAGVAAHFSAQSPLQACGGGVACERAVLAQQAVSPDTEVVDRAIAALRQQGPAGLNALWTANAESIQQHANGVFIVGATNVDPAWTKLRAALDKVSGQRDDYASGLYWYTDLDKAQAAAKSSGKPILSLRLLGRLDEEYSCANSRFFRTTLYANREISAYLRDHFILHWQSVRPVPRVTIDFGDGRKIEQTITGNSIHYILASDGQVVDALPGLYGPKAFLNNLAVAEKAATHCVSLDQSQRRKFLQTYHRESLEALLSDWQKDLLAVSGMDKSKFPRTIPIDDPIWHQVAQLHAADARLDAGAAELIQAKNPPAARAMPLAISKSYVETPMLRQIRNLQQSISEDTVRNEYRFHSVIHEWLANDPVSGGLARLNQRVYAELFLTPDSDPWLGLAPTDTFTGLENGGLVLGK